MIKESLVISLYDAEDPEEYVGCLRTVGNNTVIMDFESKCRVSFDDLSSALIRIDDYFSKEYETSKSEEECTDNPQDEYSISMTYKRKPEGESASPRELSMLLTDDDVLDKIEKELFEQKVLSADTDASTVVSDTIKTETDSSWQNC